MIVNGRTGTVTGQRPYSAVKIAFAVLAGLVAAVVVTLILTKRNQS